MPKRPSIRKSCGTLGRAHCGGKRPHSKGCTCTYESHLAHIRGTNPPRTHTPDGEPIVRIQPPSSRTHPGIVRTEADTPRQQRTRPVHLTRKQRKAHK